MIMERILVVDDEPLILRTVERALSKKGYDVRCAQSADEFLLLLNEEKADLLIMDVNLDNVNSETLLDRVSELSPQSKVLFMSGLLPDVGKAHFIEKPFKIDALRDLVRNILDGTAEPASQPPTAQ